MSVWRSRTIPRFYMWCSMKFSSKRVSTCCSFFIYVVLRRHRQLQSSGVCPRTTNVLRCSWTYSDRLAVFVFEVVAFSEVLETVSHVALRLSFRVVQRLLSKELCLRNFFFHVHRTEFYCPNNHLTRNADIHKFLRHRLRKSHVLVYIIQTSQL